MEEVVSQQETEITHQTDLSGAVRTARSEAASAGFSIEISEEIALVVCELASNLLKHAGGGKLIINHLNHDDGIILRIDAINNNGSFSNPEKAFRDGFSTTDSLGYGLGTVNRLMDTIEIIVNDSGRTVVRTQKKLRALNAKPPELNLDIGVASIPHPLMKENGDSFFIKRWKSHAMCCVIDGLGHGHEARRASLCATQYIQSHYDLPILNLFRGVQYACLATRGVVMAVVKFDREKSEGNLMISHACLGNIQTICVDCNGISGFGIICHGVLGMRSQDPVITTRPMGKEVMIIMFSDGISSNWKEGEEAKLRNISAAQGAGRLLKHYWQGNDDATAMVIKVADA